MHYRITKINHKPDSLDDLLGYLKSVESDVTSIDGLHSVTMVNISETESIVFSEYENEEQFMDNAAKTPRSNCVLDTTKAEKAGIGMRLVEEAMRESMRKMAKEGGT